MPVRFRLVQRLNLSWAETATLTLREVRFMLETLDEQDEEERKANGQGGQRSRPAPQSRDSDHKGVTLTPMT